MIRNLLFVCTGNLCRSPMAQALLAARLKERGQDDVTVASAGLAACVGDPPPPPVCSRMTARGLDVTQHRARQFTPEMAHASDLILVMDAGHKRRIESHSNELRGRVRLIGEWRGREVPDPYGRSEEAYDDCLRILEDCLHDWDKRLFA
jgi:protein-tyrosine phosphatase